MPPVSEAQRHLMQAAAHTKGGFGGVSQAVGKEFSAADKGGKLPARKKSPAEKMYGKKGYAEGGEVGQSESDRDAALKRYQKMLEDRRKTRSIDVDQKADAARQSDKFKTDPGPHPDFHKQLNSKLQDANSVEENRIDPSPATEDNNEFARGRVAAKEIELAKGGVIRQVAGKPIGKDDGIIAAQRGEYVIKKSAVKKLGSEVLDAVNKGDISKAERLYSGRRVARG